MKKKIGLAVAGLLAALVLVIATRPSTFHVERRTTIAAPPAVVHAIVNDFHGWKRFNPWLKLDPAMKIDYSGAASGKGASYSWSGNGNVGEGRMTIADSTPESIKIQLEFLKPMAGTGRSELAFKPSAGGTEVVWSMDGENNFVGKAVSLVVSMDAMIGGQYEAGLASLKQAAEEDAKGAPAPAK